MKVISPVNKPNRQHINNEIVIIITIIMSFVPQTETHEIQLHAFLIHCTVVLLSFAANLFGLGFRGLIEIVHIYILIYSRL